ncbi:FkbM family methyltransferase [Verticiella sediminum]|uniref:FkbM family methyltransferase n=1 Tax=Verticiella sediminum TaxID=1247510 RepID=UPI0014786C94|nr:FkbM family methyltransferase [Verticiella sediminum]
MFGRKRKTLPDGIPMRTDERASREDIYYCFRLILGRNPDPEEIPGHFARAGADLTAIVSTYVNSLEFARRKLLAAPGDDTYVQAEIEGFRLMVGANDEDVGKPVLAGGYEAHVTRVFRERLRPGMRVVDVGANIGYFSMLAASLVEESGHVLAFEPNPENGRLLECSRRLNGYEQVQLYQTAASDRDGLLVLNATHSNGTTSRIDDAQALLTARTVPCLQLDPILLRGGKVDFIKIDVEGAEYLALSGARELLARDRPAIVSEFSPSTMPGISGVDGPTYLRFLAELGYRYTVLGDDPAGLDCGRDVGRVMNAYAGAGGDHIDFLAVCD